MAQNTELIISDRLFIKNLIVNQEVTLPPFNEIAYFKDLKTAEPQMLKLLNILRKLITDRDFIEKIQAEQGNTQFQRRYNSLAPDITEKYLAHFYIARLLQSKDFLEKFIENPESLSSDSLLDVCKDLGDIHTDFENYFPDAGLENSDQNDSLKLELHLRFLILAKSQTIDLPNLKESIEALSDDLKYLNLGYDFLARFQSFSLAKRIVEIIRCILPEKSCQNSQIWNEAICLLTSPIYQYPGFNLMELRAQDLNNDLYANIKRSPHLPQLLGLPSMIFNQFLKNIGNLPMEKRDDYISKVVARFSFRVNPVFERYASSLLHVLNLIFKHIDDEEYFTYAIENINYLTESDILSAENLEHIADNFRVLALPPENFTKLIEKIKTISKTDKIPGLLSNLEGLLEPLDERGITNHLAVEKMSSILDLLISDGEINELAYSNISFLSIYNTEKSIKILIDSLSFDNLLRVPHDLFKNFIRNIAGKTDESVQQLINRLTHLSEKFLDSLIIGNFGDADIVLKDTHYKNFLELVNSQREDIRSALLQHRDKYFFLKLNNDNFKEFLRRVSEQSDLSTLAVSETYNLVVNKEPKARSKPPQESVSTAGGVHSVVNKEPEVRSGPPQETVSTPYRTNGIFHSTSSLNGLPYDSYSGYSSSGHGSFSSAIEPGEPRTDKGDEKERIKTRTTAQERIQVATKRSDIFKNLIDSKEKVDRCSTYLKASRRSQELSTLNFKERLFFRSRKFYCLASSSLLLVASGLAYAAFYFDLGGSVAKNIEVFNEKKFLFPLIIGLGLLLIGFLTISALGLIKYTLELKSVNSKAMDSKSSYDIEVTRIGTNLLTLKTSNNVDLYIKPDDLKDPAILKEIWEGRTDLPVCRKEKILFVLGGIMEGVHEKFSLIKE